MRNQSLFSWHELLLISLIALGETAAVALWLPLIAAMVGHGTISPQPAGLFVVGMVAYWLARLNATGQFRLLSTRTMIGLWCALVIGWIVLSAGLPIHLATVIESWAVPLLAVAAWLRGSSLASANDLASPDRAHRLLGLGVLLIGAAFVVSLAWTSPASVSARNAAWWAAPLLVLSGLFLATLGVADVVEGRVGNSVSRQRVSATGLAAGLFLLPAFLIVVLSGNANWVIDAIRVVAFAVGFALFWAIAGVAYALFYLITGVTWLFGINITLPKLPFHLFPQQASRNQPQHPMSIWAEMIYVAIAMILTSLLIRLYMPRALVFLRKRRRQRAGVQVVRSGIRSDGSLVDDVRDLFSGLGFKRRRPARVDPGAPPVSVRDAYRKLLVLAAQEGQRINATESPRDFALRLGIAWADLTGPVQDLTGRYVAARYGETSSEADFAVARQAWERIRLSVTSDRQLGSGWQ